MVGAWKISTRGDADGDGVRILVPCFDDRLLRSKSSNRTKVHTMDPREVITRPTSSTGRRRKFNPFNLVLITMMYAHLGNCPPPNFSQHPQKRQKAPKSPYFLVQILPRQIKNE